MNEAKKPDEIKIPEFTKEEYLTTSRPYEWLNSFSENRFQLMQILSQMSEKATKIGIKNLKTMFKIYQESLAKSTGNFIFNSTNVEGQELQLDCGTWRCDDYGVTGLDSYGQDEIIACMHPIMPVQRLINIDTDTEKLKIAFKKGGRWKSVIADKKTLASNNSILSLADSGVAVTSENSRALVRYLSEVENMNYDRIPEINSVGRLGWISGHGFSPYVENLVFDGMDYFKGFFGSVREHGSYTKWIEVAKDVRQGKSIASRMMLAASFASVLVEPCGGLPFFVHLWGNTESGKTVALMFATSVWACPRMGEYIHTFNSTSVAQELSASFVNSLPLVLDELQIVKDKKDFDQTIYSLAEGVGRQRGAKSGGVQRTGTWCNCILTSGEMPISSASTGGGAINRIIDVELKDALFSDPAYVAETVKKNYGHAGRDFIEKISEDGMFDRIREKQREYLKELQKSESTDKQSMSASLILTADFFATELIFKDGNNLTVDDIKPFLSTKTDVSQELRGYEYVMDVIAMNESKFSSFAHDGNERWGIIDDDNIYIVAAKFNEIVRNGGFNPTALLSWLQKNELIVHEKGRKDKQKKIGGINRRCICIKQQLIDNFIDEISDMKDEENPFSQEKLI